MNSDESTTTSVTDANGHVKQETASASGSVTTTSDLETAVNPLQQSIPMMTVEIRFQKSMPTGRKRPMNITAGIWLQKHSLMTKKEQKH